MSPKELARELANMSDEERDLMWRELRRLGLEIQTFTVIVQPRMIIEHRPEPEPEPTILNQGEREDLEDRIRKGLEKLAMNDTPTEHATMMARRRSW